MPSPAVAPAALDRPTAAPRPLRLLMVEDNPEDAELTAEELAQAGLRFETLRVQTRDDYLAALEQFQPDVILSDYRLPAFDGREALRLARERCAEVPVIIVTGALGDELAVELLRAGARDYVLKDRLARLPSSVQRALADVEEGRRRRTAEAWLAGQRELLELVARGAALPEVLRRVALFLDRLLPGASASVLRLESETGHLRLLAAPGLPDEYRRAMDGLRAEEGARACAAAVARREPVVVCDIAADPLCATCRHPGLAVGLRSAWAFPLLTGQGEAVGLLVVHTREVREPSAEERRLIAGVTPIAGLAIERTRAEQAIRAAAEEWGATFDALEAAVVILDEGDRVARSNRTAARLLGGTPADCLGRPLDGTADGEPWDEVRRAVGQWRAGRRPEASRVLDRQGRVWEVEVTPAAGPAGISHLIVTLRDATRLVRLQESADRVQRMAAMGALVAGVAHEVRNPLFAMSANVEALGLVLRGNAEVSELVAAVCEERDRISALMEDLLSYGRTAPSRRVRGPLEPVLAAALRACSALAAHLGVRLERRGSATGHELLMDAGRLEEVFHNVIENACRHTPSGGRVLLHLEPVAGGRLRIEVRDQGPGFAPEALERAFEPFFTRRKGGTGLGLPIAQRIVEEHEGGMRLANAAGGGAVVTVELPLAPSE